MSPENGVLFLIFISHSWKNKPAARMLVEALAAKGLPCWLDEQQLEVGAALRASLLRAISESDLYIYLVSKTANESEWAQDELNYAMGLEFNKKLRVIPIRLADNDDPLPPILLGRLYSTLDPRSGGATGIAHKLGELLAGHDRVRAPHRLSATVRLEEHRLGHTLKQARILSAKSETDVHVLLLNDEYESLEALYWEVAGIQFPKVKGSPQELTYATETIANIHNQSRAIIEESGATCRRFLGVSDTDKHVRYFDAGNERILRVLLHRLQWNSTYLRYLRDRSDEFDQTFLNAKHLPEPFDGHRCDFVLDDNTLGSIKVPGYGHPLPPNTEPLFPWGLTSPFHDIFEDEIGVALGDIIARRCIAQTIPSTEMPPPDLLTYGLS